MRRDRPASNHNGKRFVVLVSLSSRPVELERCSLNFLTQRYSSPSRLAQIPKFADLKALRDGHASYSGALIAYELSILGDEVRMTELTRWSATRKLQHAAIVGRRLVLCYEDQLAVFADWKETLKQAKLELLTPRLIDDPWFGGLHTVFDEDGRHCIVSSSSADGMLRIDLERNAVVARHRLPASLYGTNYELRPGDSVQDHYIHNDLQLAHLNCAYPGRDGTTWISTLIQGDIGQFAPDGSYRRISGGFVGAHGVRSERESAGIYFADSCLGLLVRMNNNGQVLTRYRVESQWLHDVQQVQGEVFLFAIADRNVLAIENVSSAKKLWTLQLSPNTGYVQFLNLIDYPEQ